MIITSSSNLIQVGGVDLLTGDAALRLLPDWLCQILHHFEVLVGREWHGAPEYSELVLNNWKINGPKDGVVKPLCVLMMH